MFTNSISVVFVLVGSSMQFGLEQQVQQRISEAVEKVRHQCAEEKKQILMEGSRQLQETVATVRSEMEGNIAKAQSTAVQEALKEANIQLNSKEVRYEYHHPEPNLASLILYTTYSTFACTTYLNDAIVYSDVLTQCNVAAFIADARPQLTHSQEVRKPGMRLKLGSLLARYHTA